jgi:sec-independent protein translocase protein TatB
VFDSIGWGEILVIALAALFIFGPERLPTLAKDAAAGLKRLRRTVSDLRGQMDESLGEDFAELRELDLRRYHPRTFLRDQIFGDDEDDVPPLRLATGNGSTGVGAVARSRNAGTPPPFDPDAT